MPYSAVLDDDDDDDRENLLDDNKLEMRLHLVTRCMSEIEVAVELSDGAHAQRCVSVLKAFLDGIPRFKGPLPSSSDAVSFRNIEEIRKGKRSANGFDEEAIPPKKVSLGMHQFSPPTANSESRKEALQSLKVESIPSRLFRYPFFNSAFLFFRLFFFCFSLLILLSLPLSLRRCSKMRMSLF
jgi:hypothetical protein